MDRVLDAIAHSMLFYGCDNWLLLVKDTRRFSVFDYRFIRSVTRISWIDPMNSSEMRRRELDVDSRCSTEVIVLHRLPWLGHFLCMPS